MENLYTPTLASHATDQGSCGDTVEIIRVFLWRGRCQFKRMGHGRSLVT